MDDFKSFPPKDPTGELDYIFDWAPLKNNRGLSNWLREGEVIVSYTVVVPEGLTKSSDSLVNDDTAIVVWLDDESAIAERYEIECSIVTNNVPPRKDKRTAILQVKKR
jgi:hypothetical protein